MLPAVTEIRLVSIQTSSRAALDFMTAVFFFSVSANIDTATSPAATAAAAAIRKTICSVQYTPGYMLQRSSLRDGLPPFFGGITV